MTLNPIEILREAVSNVPQLKYVWGIVAIVAAATIAVALVGNDPARAFVYFIIALAGVLLVAVVANTDSTGPRTFLIWVITVLFVACLVLTLTAHAFGCPNNWARLVGAAPTCGGSQATDLGIAETTAIKDGQPWATKDAPTVDPGVRPAQTSEVAFVAIKQPFEVRDASDDCGIDRRRTEELCLPQGTSITSWSGPEYLSANCGSAIENIRKVEGKPNCIAADIALKGCGYDRIVGIRNCKGRGWVQGTIVAEGIE